MSSYRRIFLLLGLLLLSWSLKASARAVISEVLWAGSDLSASDEWVEIACIDGTVGSCRLGGWTLTSLNSKGDEATIYRFATGATIDAGTFAVIANTPASSSRLLHEPFAVSPSISLPNSKLLLRLRDISGRVVDHVDDGVGAPFAGANKVATGSGFLWASMERIDLFGSGALKTNWATAGTSRGFDDAAPMRGTPGFPNAVAAVSPKDPSCPHFDASIALQSGVPVAEEKVTVNVQAVATGASVASLRCLFDFSDGTRLESCNPSSHTFVERGIHTITLRAVDRCGAAVTKSIDVEVLAPRDQTEMRYVPPFCPPIDVLSARGIVINEFLPDPAGEDAFGEWIEVKNAGPFHVRLCGLALQTSSSNGIFPLDDVVLDPGAVRSLPRSLTNLALPNAGGTLHLLLRSDDGLGHIVDEVTFPRSSVGVSWSRDEKRTYAWSFAPSPGIDTPPKETISLVGNASVEISGILPNPEGIDDDGEWVELRSPQGSVDLLGWTLDIGGTRRFLDGMTVAKGHDLRISMGSIGNEGGIAKLLDPRGNLASIFRWGDSAEGAVIRPFSVPMRRVFGIVDDVIDGDTIAVTIADAQRILPDAGRQRSFRVRFIGIDAPEMFDEENAIAKEAAERLRALLLHKTIGLEFEERRSDAYGRLLAYIFLNGRDVQADMLASGLARVSVFPFARSAEYAAIEEYARLRSAGLWKNEAND